MSCFYDQNLYTKNMAWTDPIIFFSQDFEICLIHTGDGFLQMHLEKENFQFRKPTTFSFGVDFSQCFSEAPKKTLNIFRTKNLRENLLFTAWSETRLFHRTEELGQSEPKLQLSWWRCCWRCWMMPDDWGGILFLVLAVDFFV